MICLFRIGIVVAIAIAFTASACAQNQVLYSKSAPDRFDLSLESNRDLVDRGLIRNSFHGLGVVYLSTDSMPKQAEISIGPSTQHSNYWVSQGDVVPFFGALYRIAKITSEPRNVIFERIPNSKLPGELAVDTDSIIIPPETLCELHDRSVWCDEITAGEDGQGPIARIHVCGGGQRNGEGRRVLSQRFYAHKSGWVTVSPGDTLTIDGGDQKDDSSRGKRTHVVRRIVPPDSDNHIPGWVELAPEFEVDYR